MEALRASSAAQPARAQTLVFVGFMGAGKSSAARAVAAELGVEAADSDRELERELGEPLEAFFDREGEPAFREREERAVLALLERPPAPVIALGGGSLASERVRQALGRHTVVHLEVDPEVAWRRAAGRGRPLARDPARFKALHGERQGQYESVAQASIPPAGREVARRALPALRALAEAPAGTRVVWAAAASGQYPVFLGEGLLASGFFHPGEGRRFAVTHEQVLRHHRVEAGAQLELPAGEQHKTLANAELVLRWLATEGAERGDLVVAVGGGVVGDLAGFCAAIYQRGMRHVQVPTTLVAQVDSSLGGKTGVDLPEGKNYAGAFHQPAAVLCDPGALETLPREELAAGYAEVVKTALIAGGELWERVRGGGPVDQGVILGCVRTKLTVVAADERDSGRRQVLNLGHTVGHAIEAATGYTRLRHGEAVGIGLLAALRLSGQDDLRREVAGLLEARGLPLAFDGATVDDVVALVERDKKRAGGRVPFVLLEAPGAVTPGHELEPGSLRAAVEEVRAG
ncbi:MAG TPA: bifunctional shikimate kinase/3-dehydroquinate synthase [Thermoleophilaceae bacterium]|nr:bifunctional shikimate kinase/3-dehydroquinate synthase [Thermoleophilaceae bacterium]